MLIVLIAYVIRPNIIRTTNGQIIYLNNGLLYQAILVAILSFVLGVVVTLWVIGLAERSKP